MTPILVKKCFVWNFVLKLISMGKPHTHTHTHTHTHKLNSKAEILYQITQKRLKLISVLLSLVHTLIKHWSSVVSDKIDNFSHCTVILYLNHTGSTLKALRRTWCSQQGRISLHIKHGEKMGCWVEMWQGDSGSCLGRSVTITTQETIAKVLAASL